MKNSVLSIIVVLDFCRQSFSNRVKYLPLHTKTFILKRVKFFKSSKILSCGLSLLFCYYGELLNAKPDPVVYYVLPLIDVYVFFAGFYLLIFCPGILHLCS